MIRTTAIILGIIISISSAFAQIDYSNQFLSAKQLFREGKYNLAMESFKRLIPYDKANPFSEYASFYYALSAYHQGYKAVAKDALKQIKTQYPKWDKLDDVNFWLAKIQLDEKEYFQGFKTLENIQTKSLAADIAATKEVALDGILDVETLKRLNAEHPKDEIIARAYAAVLANNLSVAENHDHLEKLLNQFKWKSADFFPEAPKTIFKEIYTVSVLMPFMVNTLDPTPSRKRNQIVLDFYEGMRLAADTLQKQGIKISLRAYDTQRRVEKIKALLDTDELKSSDLLVGPFFQEENGVIQEFSQANKINIFNPLSQSIDQVEENPFGFLYQASTETLGQKSGSFLADYVNKKVTMVYYGTSKRDSTLAANFKAVAESRGVKIVSYKRVTRDAYNSIMTTLATPTEFDDYKYPKQFSLKKDSIGSIFVASDDPLIYNKVLSAVETRGDSIVVLGSEAWLDQAAVDLEKYQILPVVLAAQNFAVSSNPYYQAFIKSYNRVFGKVPSTYARMGYEFMLFAGHQLKENGVYFQEALNKKGFIPGYLTTGFQYQYSKDNDLIPFMRFVKGKATIIDKR
jgi:ABC-type branched-subunit amino acid transport system substrate-binding protein/DNA-binding SARP family transcriptional activator